MAFELISKNFELVVEKRSKKSSVFSAGPLLRGLGHTLGNALRRTTLSLEEGFAIRYISFEPAVAHQYDAVPGVSQDVQEIILRLKKFVLSVKAKKKKKKFASPLKAKKSLKPETLPRQTHHLKYSTQIM